MVKITITEPITLTEAKSFLRVSHNLDDSYITSLISVAREFVENYQGRLIAIRTAEDPTEEVPEYEAPSELEKQAMLLLIGYYYDNRAAAVGANIVKIPLGVENLLYFNRKDGVLVQ